MLCWPRLLCRPGLRTSLSPSAFGSPRSVRIAPQIPFSSAFHIAKHILRASPSSIPSHRDYVLRYLSNTVTFQNT